MALREQFEQSGRWLFRWRGYLPLLILALVLWQLRHFQYFEHSRTLDDLWELGCLLVSFFGLAIRAWVIGHVPQNTSGRNTREQRADSLNTDGIYSMVRHPLYVGNFFIYLGITLFPHVWWLTALCVLLFWLHYERIMFAEEAYLRDKFGDAYVIWAERTPAFIPNPFLWRRSSLGFSVRNVLRREYNNFFTIVIALFALECVGDYVADGHLEIDPAWAVFLVFGFAVWIVLRTVKRKTNWLRVSGR